MNEYDAIRRLTGLGYKLYSVVKMMTKDGKADENGWVHLSFNQMRRYLNVHNIARILDSLANHSDIIEVQRSGSLRDGVTKTKLRINKELL